MKTKDILFYQSNHRPVTRYVSSATVYEECLHGGRYIGLYWSSSGMCQRENVVDTYPAGSSWQWPSYDPAAAPLDAFCLEIDGQTLHNQWEWVESFRRQGNRPGTEEAVVVLKHRIRPVSVSVVTCLDGTEILTRYLEITNTGEHPAALSSVTAFSGLLWHVAPGEGNKLHMPFDHTAKAEYSLGYMKSVDWGLEGDFTWRPLDDEIFRIERRGFEKFGSPYYLLKNETNGELFFIALGWPGDYYAEFRHGKTDHCLSVKTGPYGNAPMRVIDPGETVISPKVHIGPIRANFDTAVEKWHRHMRSFVLPKRPDDKKMYTIAGRMVEKTGDWILREIDIAAEMGAEAFMVDAGWYGSDQNWGGNRGDWNEAHFLPEGGICGIREYVHKKGMLFGLWMEPEALSPASSHWKEHPEQRLTGDPENREVYSNLIDLANPEAAKYVEESMRKVIGGFELDFFKTDFNQRLYGGGVNYRHGYAEGEEWRHYEVMFKIYDRLRKDFPSVAFENCSSGGGRNDAGMLEHAHYCCESDYSLFPFSIRAINAMTLFIPPEAVCYYHNHLPNAHLTTDADTHLRVTLFSQPIYVGFGAQNMERDGVLDDKTRKYIELSKGFCRAVMGENPKVYHHTPFIGLTKPETWCVLEYASADKSRGYAGIFKIGANEDDSEYVFRPRGIDKSLDYEITTDNDGGVFTVSGVTLASSGIVVRLDLPNTSELILYKAIK